MFESDDYLLAKREWRIEHPGEVRPGGCICPHRIAVLDALRRRLYVPRRVREEYPDLEKAYPELFTRYRRPTSQDASPAKDTTQRAGMNTLTGSVASRIRSGEVTA